MSQDELNDILLDVENVMPVREKAHLKLKLLAFGEVARGVGGFGAEKRSEGKDALIDPDHDLLVELAALRERRGIAKVIDVEKLGSPFRRGPDDIGGKVLD